MLAVKTNKPFNPSEEIQTRIREVMELYPEGLNGLFVFTASMV